MPNTTQCPSCGQQYDITPEYAGKRVECVCGTEFTVPEIQKKTPPPIDVSGAKKIPPPINAVATSTPSTGKKDHIDMQTPVSHNSSGKTPLIRVLISLGLFLAWFILFSVKEDQSRNDLFQRKVKDLISSKNLSELKSISRKYRWGYWFAGDIFKDHKEIGAENGSPDIQILLGDIYYREAKYDKARYWYYKASKQGSLTSDFSLALMLLKGKGCQKDVSQAVDILRRLSSKGHPQAKHLLGVILLERGDAVAGFRLITEAAELGVPAAQQLIDSVKNENK